MRIDHSTDHGSNRLFVSARGAPSLYVRERPDRRDSHCDVAMRDITSVEIEVQDDTVERRVILNFSDSHGATLRVMMHSNEDMMAKLAALICGQRIIGNVADDEVLS